VVETIRERGTGVSGERSSAPEVQSKSSKTALLAQRWDVGVEPDTMRDRKKTTIDG